MRVQKYRRGWTDDEDVELMVRVDRGDDLWDIASALNRSLASAQSRLSLLRARRVDR